MCEGVHSRVRHSCKYSSFDSPSPRLLMTVRKAARRKTWASPESQLLLTLCHGLGDQVVRDACGLLRPNTATEVLGAV